MKRSASSDSSIEPFHVPAVPSKCRHVLSSVTRPLDHFLLLPSHLLIQIFSLIPVRPRRMVLSLVSKRWRDYACCSMTLIPRLDHIPQLPSLTFLRLTTAMVGEIALPTSLRKLSFRGAGTLATYTAAAHLPSLTSLAICSANNAEFYSRFLLKYVPSLCFLKINGMPCLVQHYPSLTALSLAIPSWEIVDLGEALLQVWQMLQLHASQLLLLKLSIKLLPWNRNVLLQQLSPFSRLQRLVLKEDGATWYAFLRSRIPPTCGVSVAYDLHSNGPLTAELCPVLTSLSLQLQELQLVAMLPLCTRLTSLTFHIHPYYNYTFPASLRKLYIADTRITTGPDWLLQFSHLEELCVHIALPARLHSISQHLRRLTFDWRMYIYDRMQGLRNVISACPRLQYIAHFADGDEMSDSNFIPINEMPLADFVAVATFARARGIEEIRVSVLWNLTTRLVLEQLKQRLCQPPFDWVHVVLGERVIEQGSERSDFDEDDDEEHYGDEGVQ